MMGVRLGSASAWPAPSASLVGERSSMDQDPAMGWSGVHLHAGGR